MNKFKISLITSLFSGKGGTERAVINLANNLCNNNKVKIISVFTDKNDISKFSISEKVEIIHLGLGKYNFFYRIYKLWRILKHHIKTDDFIIGHVPFINILLGLYRLFKIISSNCKTIAIEHTSFFAVKKITRLMTLFAYKYIDKVVSLTQYSAEQFDKKGIHRTKVIPNVVSFTSSKISTCSEKVILSVGRMSSEKNFTYIIESLSDILKENIDWQLHIIGDIGNDTQNIYNTIQKFKLEGSIIIENFTNDISEKYLSSSIYVLASKYEGFPMVLIEAKIFGLPIVAHDCLTGPKEIIKENDGILTPYMDSIAFSKAVKELIDDKERRVFLGKNAVKNAKEFSSDVILSKWNNLFEELKK